MLFDYFTKKLHVSTCHYTIVSLDKLVFAAIHKSLTFPNPKKQSNASLSVNIFTAMPQNFWSRPPHTLSLFLSDGHCYFFFPFLHSHPIFSEEPHPLFQFTNLKLPRWFLMPLSWSSSFQLCFQNGCSLLLFLCHRFVLFPTKWGKKGTIWVLSSFWFSENWVVFNFCFLRFGVENDVLIAGVWLSIFKSVF